MTLNSQPIAGPASWQSQLRDVVTSGEELLDLLGLEPGQAGLSEAAARGFALKVPRAFIRRMRRGDPDDPLLRQVLASKRELLEMPGFSNDPVGETGAVNARPGLLRKYRGRALLLVSGGCAVNCRYCFRRHFPYADNRVNRLQWRDTLAEVAGDTTISEVILSGGDPLMPGDRQLDDLVSTIAAIPHVRRLRVHTRLPVVIPARVTDELITALSRPNLDTVFVIHANHANEIDAETAEATGRLRSAGFTVLNQSVLLRGVNDSVKALVDLSEALFAAGVLPYYLHLLDRVAGAAHFDVAEVEAVALWKATSAQLPGYLVPKLVREIAGEPGKSAVPVS
ncbi:EF-P beta-lysylation protein EpmB [Haliea sp. E17]|uniref:EF-P beta-lysylation protein EpmB n=1 Tax=Haliea sp. E17 TaxID=3401576 RepID=UPI003AADF111